MHSNENLLPSKLGSGGVYKVQEKVLREETKPIQCPDGQSHRTKGSHGNAATLRLDVASGVHKSNLLF